MAIAAILGRKKVKNQASKELPPLAIPEEKKEIKKELELPEIKGQEDDAKELPSLGQPEISPEKIEKDEAEGPINKSNLDRRSYFSSLRDAVNKPGRTRELLTRQDLFERMKDNWAVQKESFKKNSSGMDDQKIELEVKQRLEELSDLETKWMSQKKSIEEEQKFLRQREEEIKERADEFKKELKDLQLHQPINSEKFLILSNGMVIKNLKELRVVIKMLDNRTFKNHVQKDRNDFADWARHFNRRLARMLSKSKTKEEMLKILEEES